MSLEQIVPINVVLGAGAVALPQFGTSLILETLTTQQFGKFIVQSGGLSVLQISDTGVASTLTSLGISSGEQAAINATSHFQGIEKPDKAFLGFRGVADQKHLQTMTVLPESGSLTQASVGLYQLTEIEGGPYQYTSPGVAQVVTLTVTDAGGGDGAPGIYTVSDLDGNNFTHASGGINVWTLTIDTAAVGLYTLVVSGVTYTYTAGAGDTVENIRDGLFADTTSPTAHPPHPTWTGSTNSTDEIIVTSNAVGVTLVVTTNSGPGATEATLVETTAIAPETIAAISLALTTAITGATSPPARWDPVDGTGTIVITANVLNIGVDLGIGSSGPAPGDLTQVITTDHRETITVVRDALDTALTAAAHPTFTNATSGSDAELINGVTDGVVIIATASGPNGNLVLTETQGVLTLRTAQVTRIKVNPDASLGGDAFEGTYEVTSFGLPTVIYVNPAASGKSVTDVRDDLVTAVAAGIPNVTVTPISTDNFDMTNITLGQSFTVVLVSPSSNSGLSQSTPTPGLSIRDDIDRARSDIEFYFLINASGSAVDITEATAHMDDIASESMHMHFWQSANDAMKDTPAISGSDEGVDTNATGTLRSKGLWSPVPASPQDTYEGQVSQWVGRVSVKLPGQIQWATTSLLGLTSKTDLTAQQEKNLTDRNVSHADFVGSLPLDQQHPVQGPFCPSGRNIDLQRAADQVRAVYQLLAASFIISQPIIDYTNAGLGTIHNAVVAKGTRILKDQGLVISDAVYNNAENAIPTRADATAQEIQDGIAPLFDFTITIQLGITQIPIKVTVTQGGN